MSKVARFLLSNDEAAHRLAVFLRANRKTAADSGHPLLVTVAPFHATMSAIQRRELWGFILKPIADQAVVGGRHHDADVWAIHCKREFLPETCAKGIDKWRELPDGTRELMMGTGDLNEQEMAEYMLRCRVFAQQELGVELPIREPT